MKNKKFTLMIHGGAGLITNTGEYEKSISTILKQGKELLANGSSALDVVEACVVSLENDPIFNAGKGSVLNENGEVEADASIMNGKDMSAGAVAAVTGIKNPVSLARLVMEKSKNVLLLSSGAMQFAEMHSVRIENLKYFVTKAREKQLVKAKKDNSVFLDHSNHTQAKTINDKLGTVGAVALDIDGNIAAATSTGGLVNKSFGRVGDSPIVGSGVFADNDTCAVSCTGIGEHFLITNLPKMVSDYMFIRNMDVKDASAQAIKYFTDKIKGLGGFIAISNNGDFTAEFTTPQMIYGYATHERVPTVKFDKL